MRENRKSCARSYSQKQKIYRIWHVRKLRCHRTWWQPLECPRPHLHPQSQHQGQGDLNDARQSPAWFQAYLIVWFLLPIDPRARSELQSESQMGGKRLDCRLVGLKALSIRCWRVLVCGVSSQFISPFPSRLLCINADSMIVLPIPTMNPAWVWNCAWNKPLLTLCEKTKQCPEQNTVDLCYIIAYHHLKYFQREVSDQNLPTTYASIPPWHFCSALGTSRLNSPE